jgi:hypothetical protein
MTKYSILFYLNQQLSFVQIKNYSDLDSVDLKTDEVETASLNKAFEKSVELILISELSPDPILNLASKLENFWIQNWPEIKDAQELQLWIGPKAGFTNTRMLYIWLKSWSESKNIKLKIWNSPALEFNSNLNLDTEFKNNFLQSLKSANLNYRLELQYSAIPRIGIK